MGLTTYKVAILGCGGRGRASGRAYQAHPRTEVVALCDLVPELRERLGEELSVSTHYSDLDQMLIDTRPDILVISTGTEFHYELCMRVVKHGVNIDVEKPITIDLEQADTLLAQAAEHGVKIAVHHQGRVGGSLRALSAALREGRIGKARYLSASDKGYYGGYGLMNIGCHLINNLLELAGPCRGVSAVALTGNSLITPDDVVQSPLGMGTIAGEHITAVLHFDESVTATLKLHPFSIDTDAYAIEVFGANGRLLWLGGSKSRGAYQLTQPHFVPGIDTQSWEPLEPVRPFVYDEALSPDPDDVAFADEYVKAIDEDRPHRCSGEQGRHVLEVMMGIFESAAYRRYVALPQSTRVHPLLQWRREAGLPDPEPVPRPYGEWLAAENDRIARLIESA